MHPKGENADKSGKECAFSGTIYLFNLKCFNDVDWLTMEANFKVRSQSIYQMYQGRQGHFKVNLPDVAKNTH